MTLQELRFFSIYLSKINARDLNTRVVRFPMDDFQAVMELSSRIKIDYMKTVTANLLRQIVAVRDEKTGGYSQFQLFKECTVNQDDNGEWYVEIDAHDKALPLMFEFKAKYFSYQLWNALRLKSSNQLRMYELLKQYEKVGTRIWEVEELKKDLWLENGEYPRYDNFKNRILDPCQEALAKYTDIRFTYEPHGKKGKGGKILRLKFNIEANKDYTDQLTLDMFIVDNRHNEDDIIDMDDDDENSTYKDRIEFFKGACDNEFSFTEIEILSNKMRECLSPSEFKDQLYCYHYINDRYKNMQRRADKGGVRSRFGYVKKIISEKI